VGRSSFKQCSKFVNPPKISQTIDFIANNLKVWHYICTTNYIILQILKFYLDYSIIICFYIFSTEAIVVVIAWWLDLQLSVQSVPAVSSNLTQGEVYFNTTLCDKVCQWLVTHRWFSLGTLVSSINKTDRHDIAEILLKVAVKTLTLF
jgi:hypothetical protein